MRSYSFRVPGEPIPQPRPKISTRGGFGRAYVPSTHLVHTYRQAIALAAKAARTPESFAGDVAVDVEFVFPRPQSHVTKRGAVRSNVPARPRADLDNLVKGLQDALNGIAFVDDSQVVKLAASKRYAPAYMPGVTLVTLHFLGGDHDGESADGRASDGDLRAVGERCEPHRDQRAFQCAGGCGVRPEAAAPGEGAPCPPVPGKPAGQARTRRRPAAR